MLGLFYSFSAQDRKMVMDKVTLSPTQYFHFYAWRDQEIKEFIDYSASECLSQNKL